jgi:hypothetical protein
MRRRKSKETCRREDVILQRGQFSQFRKQARWSRNLPTQANQFDCASQELEARVLSPVMSGQRMLSEKS